MKSNKSSPELSSDFFETTRKLMGERIRQLWNQSGELQDIFAKELGISTVTLSNYMTGKRKPDSEFLLAIKRKLNIRIDWLLTGEGPMRLSDSPQTHEPHGKTSPAALDAIILCPRCTRLEAELELEKAERRGLSDENRQWAIKMEQILRENGDLRELCAKLEVR